MDLGTLFRTQLDRVIAVIGIVAALIALLTGWLGVSRSAYVAQQVSYLVSGGVTAVMLAGVAATLWLSADLRDEWRKLDSIDEALRALAGTDLVRADEVTTTGTYGIPMGANGADGDDPPAEAAVVASNGNGTARRRPLRPAVTLERSP